METQRKFDITSIWRFYDTLKNHNVVKQDVQNIRYEITDSISIVKHLKKYEDDMVENLLRLSILHERINQERQNRYYI